MVDSSQWLQGRGGRVRNQAWSSEHACLCQGTASNKLLQQEWESRVSSLGQPSNFIYLQIFKNGTVHIFIFLFFLKICESLYIPKVAIERGWGPGVPLWGLCSPGACFRPCLLLDLVTSVFAVPGAEDDRIKRDDSPGVIPYVLWNVTLEALGRIDGSIERLELCEGTAVALRKKTLQ